MRMISCSRSFGVALCLLAAAVTGSAYADVRVPAIFGSNMVLQRNMKAPIWGTASPGEHVVVQIGARKVRTTADESGHWMVRIGPYPAGGPHKVLISGPNNTLEFENVLFGEVWVASGQSNMEWPLILARDGENEVRNATNPKIRLFVVAKAALPEPATDCKGSWAECSPESARNFSAVGYFFARNLYRRLQVPIGIIQSAWGGTPAESWTNRKWLESDPDFEAILARIPPPGQTTKPDDPSKPAWDSWTPTSLFNGMIAPIVPYGIAGAIWYQGESNAGRAYQYRKLFPAMIRCWREVWGQKDFPFLWVQLANFMKQNPEPGESAWAELREAQTMTLALPKTGQAIAIDIGEADDIHPRNKQDVGLRLALQAQVVAYGDRDVLANGPMYDGMTVRGNTVTVKFAHAGSGLSTSDGLPVAGFAIAGADRKFYWAEGKIQGNTVVLSSPRVDAPVAVRYAWADNPRCNLVNSAGLPACPFRTDNWPGVTVNNR